MHKQPRKFTVNGPYLLGRPQDELCTAVASFGKLGMGREEIAAALNVGLEELQAAEEGSEALGVAMLRAKEAELAWWLAAARYGIMQAGWNIRAWEVQMQIRFGRLGKDAGETMENADRLREKIMEKLDRLAAEEAREPELTKLLPAS